MVIDTDGLDIEIEDFGFDIMFLRLKDKCNKIDLEFRMDKQGIAHTIKQFESAKNKLEGK